MTETDAYEPEALVARLTPGVAVRLHVSPEAVLTCGCRADMANHGRVGVLVEVSPTPTRARCRQCGWTGYSRGRRFRVRIDGEERIWVVPAVALVPIEEAAR